MALVAPTPITALPAPPSTSDPANFDERADAFLGALPAFGQELNRAAQTTHANAAEATEQMRQELAAASTARQAAQDAAASAAQHAASASQASHARSWAAGQAWQVNDVVWGVSQPGVLYRCIAAHSGSSTAPEADAAHWVSIGARIALDPLAGPVRATFERDAHGRVLRVTSLVDGKPQVDTFERDANGRIHKVKTTFDGKTRIETYTRHAQTGQIQTMTAEVV